MPPQSAAVLTYECGRTRRCAWTLDMTVANRVVGRDTVDITRPGTVPGKNHRAGCFACLLPFRIFVRLPRDLPFMRFLRAAVASAFTA